MENLVCDLQTALDLNIKMNNNDRPVIRSYPKCNLMKLTKIKHSKDKKFYRQSNLKHKKKNKIDCCNLTESIVSQAVLSTSSLNNLVRFKTTAASNRSSREKLYVKTKAPRKIFKIQKTFRFRNYRLRCIRLRRESRQQQRDNKRRNESAFDDFNNYSKKQKPSSRLMNLMNKNMFFKENNDLSSNKDNSSSCVDTNENSNFSVTSGNSYVTTSISSASDNELSLTECFKSTKFLNSSDPSKEDEDYDDSRDIKYLDKLIENRSFKNKSYTKLSRKSIKTNRKLKSNYDFLQTEQYNIINNTVLKRKRYKDDDDDETIIRIGSRNASKNKRDVPKKLRFRNNNDRITKFDSLDHQFIIRYLKKNSKCIKTNKYEDTSGKETDEDSKIYTDMKMKNSIRKSQIRLKLADKTRLSSNDDAHSADDEHSDWPGYEKTPKDTYKETEFKVIPWWEDQNIEDLTAKSSYFDNCLSNSNYNIVNRNEDEKKVKEFDELLSGTLSLMSPFTQNNFQTNINKSMNSRKNKQRSHRSSTLATGSMKIATKSSTNMDVFNEHKPIDAPALTENNKGYKMLQKMGWSPGSGADPVIAIVRPKKQGLGFGTSKDKNQDDYK